MSGAQTVNSHSHSEEKPRFLFTFLHATIFITIVIHIQRHYYHVTAVILVHSRRTQLPSTRACSFFVPFLYLPTSDRYIFRICGSTFRKLSTSLSFLCMPPSFSVLHGKTKHNNKACLSVVQRITSFHYCTRIHKHTNQQQHQQPTQLS